MAAPRKGDIIDGYEFLGGDPNDQRSWQFWGEGARRLPTGAVVRDGPRGGLQTLGKADPMLEEAPIREFEANAAARATLMDTGLEDYRAARVEGYDPSHWKNVVARAVEDGPLIGGNYLSDVIRDNVSEKGRAAELQFVEGALRTTTGANAPDPEVVRANRQYFRQPGESEAVEKNRDRLRQRFRNTSVTVAGRAYQAPPPRERDGIPDGWRTRLTPAQLKTSQMFKGSLAKGGSQKNPFAPTSEDEFEKLPRGAYFINPADGRVLKKGR